MAIAYFSTWTTYGTWLPGDLRGWYQAGRGLRGPDARREFQALLLMTESDVTLEPEQRRLVEATIADHCALRNWELHAVKCLSNHVHVAVTAPKRDITVPREQFKAWCTRRLNKRGPVREHWWTERGWDEYLDDDVSLANVVTYITEGQEWGPR